MWVLVPHCEEFSCFVLFPLGCPEWAASKAVYRAVSRWVLPIGKHGGAVNFCRCGVVVVRYDCQFLLYIFLIIVYLSV
ncbi:hypothetical protein Hanom_Chr06g00574341 [Helianthus anomalus]